jgi:hypothetical protein
VAKVVLIDYTECLGEVGLVPPLCGVPLLNSGALFPRAQPERDDRGGHYVAVQHGEHQVVHVGPQDH